MRKTKLEATLNAFMGVTGKSKVAVVVPLYGYWDDSETQQFSIDTLKITMDRVYSLSHQVYVLFVAEEKRLPKPIGNMVVKHMKAGNSKGISVEEGSSYADYVRAGIAASLDETTADYVVIVNPWVVLQHNSIDMLVDRANRDDIKVACGYDIKGLIESQDFDRYSAQIPVEVKGISMDFMAMKRSTAEVIIPDPKFKTCQFLSRDMWQTAYLRGYESIITQRVPVFTFDVEWKELMKPEEFEADRNYFISKWKYDPGIKYE